MEKAPRGIIQRRKYDKIFKDDAVLRVVRTGKTCAEVGQELGISGNLLAKWRQERLEADGASAGSCEALKPKELAEELKAAHREIEDLREQRDILKKALSIFSLPSSNGGRS
ncbi:MAG: transposase [Lentisphaerota bacterium]